MDAEQADTSRTAATRETAGGRPVVYLHIGAAKSGTTYLQDILWRNRSALREDGVLYPGRRYAAHFRGAQDLRDTRFQGFEDPAVPGAWARLVDEARGWSGTTIISHELFSPATSEQVDRAMAALSFAEVHLVYTARDLARQIPATWQEDVKNGGTLEFAEFVRSLRAPAEERHHLGTAFWRLQGADEILDRWARDIAPERVHVVTVPVPGAPPGLLWQRFAGLVGLDPARYDTSAARPNPSLGAAEASLLRRVNLALDRGLDWPAYSDLVKRYLAQEALAGRPNPMKIALEREDHAWTVFRATELVKRLREAGYDVVGDLDELIPPPDPGMTGHPAPDEVPPELELEAAIDAIVALLPRRLSEEIRELERELTRRRQHPIKTLVRDLSERHAAVMRARAAWWHAVELARGIRPRG